MFTRVLFPTDFSAYANAVFACLPDLRSAGMREILLVGIIRESDVPMAGTINVDSLERVRWSVEEKLNIARMALEGKGLRVIMRAEYGSPAAQIVRVADEESVHLIFMGAQGKTLAHELLMGSVAHEVVRRSRVPILIQKFHVVREMGHVKCSQICEKMFARVLHPTDFSECSEAAYLVVKRLKPAGVEEVILLHVQDTRVMEKRSAEQLAEFDRLDTERLDELRKALRLYGIHARIMLRHGIPFRETLKVAEEEEPCLIALGAQGRSAMQEIFAGSTMENVVRHCRQPVLVVRPEMIEQI